VASPAVLLLALDLDIASEEYNLVADINTVVGRGSRLLGAVMVVSEGLLKGDHSSINGLDGVELAMVVLDG